MFTFSESDKGVRWSSVIVSSSEFLFYSNLYYDGFILIFGSRITGFECKADLDSPLIFIVKPDVEERKYYYSNEKSHKVEKGMPAVLTAPAKVGKYEIRYYSYANGTVLKRAPLEVTPAELSLDIPKEIPAGKLFDVSWSGPNSNKDAIFVAEKTMDHNRYYYSDYRGFRVQKDKSGKLIAPAKPGDYEVRYYSYNNGDILKRVSLTVIDAEVTLDAPRMASIGSEIEINWTGPKAPDDLLFRDCSDLLYTFFHRITLQCGFPEIECKDKRPDLNSPIIYFQT